MGKSFSNPSDVQEIKNRLAQLTPATERQWGSMTAHQMICHLSDSAKLPLRERSADPMKRPMPAIILRFIFLTLPVQWSKGPKAAPVNERDGGGTAAAEFEVDRKSFIELTDRLVAMDEKHDWPPNPFFGSMNAGQWKRWGWLHLDHHLRQFGL